MTETLFSQSVAVDGWQAFDFVDPPADENGNVWIWETISGWFGNLPVRANPVDRPMLDGVYDGPSRFGPRTIEIGGTLIAPDRASLQRGMDKIACVLASSNRVADLTVDEAQRQLKRTSTVRLGGPTMVTRTGPYSAEWSISLFAADPLRYSDVWHSRSTTAASEGAGRYYDLIPDRIYGALGSQGRMDIFNAGNASTAPIITFNGPCVNPMMQLVETGEHIALTTTLVSNERIVVDVYARTVLLYQTASNDNAVNRRNTMTTDSRWFMLPPGYSNVYYIESSNSRSLGEIRWRDAWI